jgi:hypothetical protein
MWVLVLTAGCAAPSAAVGLGGREAMDFATPPPECQPMRVRRHDLASVALASLGTGGRPAVTAPGAADDRSSRVGTGTTALTASAVAVGKGLLAWAIHAHADPCAR